MREQAKRIKADELLEKVKDKHNVLAKEKDELNRGVFYMECKIKELEVINAYQKDAIKDLRRRPAAKDKQYTQCKMQTKGFATVLRNKFDGFFSELLSYIFF